MYACKYISCYQQKIPCVCTHPLQSTCFCIQYLKEKHQKDFHGCKSISSLKIERDIRFVLHKLFNKLFRNRKPFEICKVCYFNKVASSVRTSPLNHNPIKSCMADSFAFCFLLSTVIFPFSFLFSNIISEL